MMKKEDCKVGMVVSLLSGGPSMTINCVLTYDAVKHLPERETYCIQCTWFTREAEKRCEWFNPATLAAQVPHPFR